MNGMRNRGSGEKPPHGQQRERSSWVYEAVGVIGHDDDRSRLGNLIAETPQAIEKIDGPPKEPGDEAIRCYPI